MITSASIVVSMIFWTPVGIWEIVYTGWHPLSLVAWLCIIWLALLATVVAYLAWFQGLARVEASSAASALFIQPLFGTFLAIVLLHDQLTPMTVVGGILIIASVYLISRH
jgi:drug/metabolite transporter (DMT)-like permease